MRCRKRRGRAALARRDLRQLGLADGLVQRRGKGTAWLDQLDAAIDWAAVAVETSVAGIYASRGGGRAYPLVPSLKLLLLRQWYGLADEGLEAAGRRRSPLLPPPCR